MVGPDRIARLVSLFREDASLVECVEWLREIYLWALEKKQGAQELLDSVISLLNDGLLPDHVLVERIDSNGLWVLQHGARLPLDQLSDGYRTTAALVMDIVRHLYRCFGRLEIVEATDDDGIFLEVPHGGVFLIDEVDLHLHVSWQKQIGFWLKRHFPRIQFIVTTHSPFICQAADTRGLIRLPAPGEVKQAKHVSETLYNTIVNGGADDAVLTELFGLESPYSAESERLRERIAHLETLLQSGKARERDRRELKDLRARLPQNLTADVEQALRKLAINE
jgi:predicted ATP-binding protein involved in virulence